MNYSKIAVRYAKALFNLTVEKDILNQAFHDIQLVEQIIVAKPELKEILCSKVISNSKKKEIFDAIFKDSILSISRDFFHLVITNNRESFISDICRNYGNMYRNEKNIMLVGLRSAVLLKNETVEEIKKILTKTYQAEIIMNSDVDESLIGGFILKIEEKQLDSSVATVLKKIKKELSINHYQKKL
jgi:F-type H+-transporting ATPase subunit delta